MRKHSLFIGMAAAAMLAASMTPYSEPEPEFRPARRSRVHTTPPRALAGSPEDLLPRRSKRRNRRQRAKEA